jgi:hypothetical protein
MKFNTGESGEGSNIIGMRKQYYREGKGTIL